MPATFAKDGAMASLAGGNDIGGMSSGIGVGALHSGAPLIQTATAADYKDMAIGGGALASSSSNLGNVIQGIVTGVAGSGYTNGTYRVPSDASGGQAAGCGELEIVITAGAIASRRVTRAGAGFTSAPTFTIANARNVVDGSGPGAGTLGTMVVTVAQDSAAVALGAAFGTNKGTRYLVAAGAVANNAAVSGGYLNRSGRAMVAGEATWAVAP
jgi:hypothetical protein